MEINLENYTDLKNKQLSRADIASSFGIPEWKLKRLISKNNWGNRLPTISNTQAFDEYSEESCYWAGFLMADGNVDSKHRIRIMLKYDDINHLEKFRDYLVSTHKVSSNTTTYNRASFEITNPHMCDMLDLNFNIVPNKTLIADFPRSMPRNMLRHFIRGYFDGDGSICESFSNKNSITATIYATFACGSFKFIDYLFTFLKAELGVNGYLQDFNTGKKWQIKYNTNDAKKLLHYMYDNSSVYLDRKFQLFNRIVVDNNRLQR